jgi:hypothetical protein
MGSGFLYKGTMIEVNVDQSKASFMVVKGPDVMVNVFGMSLRIAREGVKTKNYLHCGSRDTGCHFLGYQD